jgi:YesN/AraC family two-component response regulator
LQRSGFEVLSAADGSDALEVARSYKGSIDILVSDVMMPGMTGPDLANALQSLRPQMRVLLISAFSDFPVAMQERWEFLNKPFPPAVMLDKIRDLLPGDSQPAAQQSPDEMLRMRMREARAQYVRYSQEYDLLLAVTGNPSAAPPDRKLALRQAAEVRKSTLHAYAEAVRQFADFLRFRQMSDGPSANAAT